jgi:4-cresol dehydrogenase (hydroxylating)
MVTPRAVLPLIEIFYDKSDRDEGQRALALHKEIIEAAALAGFPQYRTSVADSERVLQHAPEFQRFLNRMHDSIDPNGVLAPGRYGIGIP